MPGTSPTRALAFLLTAAAWAELASAGADPSTHGAFGPTYASSAYPNAVAPPHLHRISPDKGPVRGGTRVTMYGAGFTRSRLLTARFSHRSGEVDEVPLTYVSESVAVGDTPPRDGQHDAHVSVANNGVAFSSYPLRTEEEGTFLLFSYSDSVPVGTWTLDNSTGPSLGGTIVTIDSRADMTSSYLRDSNFLPSRYLSCAFGTATVRAEWISYGRIRCRTPPWDGLSDNDVNLGGRQVTVYVTNDGVTYVPSVPLADARYATADGATSRTFASRHASFTYYTAETFVDAPVQMAAAEGPNDVVVQGTYRGDGVAWFEVAIDGGGGDDPDTFRWRMHPFAYNASSTADYAELAVPVSRAATYLTMGISVVFAHGNLARKMHAQANFYGLELDDSSEGVVRSVETAYLTSTELEVEVLAPVKHRYRVRVLQLIHANVRRLLYAPSSPLGLAHSNSTLFDATVAPGAIALMTCGSLSQSLAPQDVSLHASNASLVVRGVPALVFWGDVGPLDSGGARVGGFAPLLANGSTLDAGGLKVGSGEPVKLSIVGDAEPTSRRLVGVDTWIFRVGGGRPHVHTISTTGGEPHYAARGPFEGNTEITVYGNHLLPSEHLRCQLFDPVTGVRQSLPAHYDNERVVRCTTLRHEPLPGGQRLATMRPCFLKTLQASSDGGASWSTASAGLQYLFCDVYVSVEGSDATGHGTPDRPYQTIQRAIEASLSKPRAYYSYKAGTFAEADPTLGMADAGYTGVLRRSGSQMRSVTFGNERAQSVSKGFGYFVNRDRIILQNGVYGGAGNVALHPLGRVVEVFAENRGYASIHCGDSGMPAVLVSDDRHAGEDITSRGSVSLFGVPTAGCDNVRVAGGFREGSARPGYSRGSEAFEPSGTPRSYPYGDRMQPSDFAVGYSV